MRLKSVMLDDDLYHEYLAGKEIRCEAGKLTNRDISEGEHVMVYRDTVAANTSISPPKSELQSEYIGIEGVVTQVFKTSAHDEGVAIKKI